MKILHVLDSLEINGGSSMCFEMAIEMKRQGLFVECLVVSKTGGYGRKNIVANDIMKRLCIKAVKYDEFERISSSFRDHHIIHHRLECTRPLTFSVRPKTYLVVNHTVQQLKRVAKFSNADVVVSVCNYLRTRSPKINIPHEVILNGVAKNSEAPKYNNAFTTGRCHRLPTCKFSVNSLKFLDSLKIPGHVHYIAGPDSSGIKGYVKHNPQTCVKYLGKIDDQDYKKRTIKSFDLYFYDTYEPEGASMAILEGLAAGAPVLCKPLGGNAELVKNGINGFYYNGFKEAKGIITSLYENKMKLQEIKKSTEKDFDNRLSIENCVNKYVSFLEKRNG